MSILYTCENNGVRAVVDTKGYQQLVRQRVRALELTKPDEQNGPAWQQATKEFPSPPIATFVRDRPRVNLDGHDGTFDQLKTAVEAGGHTLMYATFGVPNSNGRIEKAALTDDELTEIFGPASIAAVSRQAAATR